MVDTDKDFPTEEEAQENQEKGLTYMKDFINFFFWFTMGATAMFLILLVVGNYY